MKRVIVLTTLIFSLAGCAFLSNQKTNWEACKQDVECYSEAKKWQQTGELVGGLAGSAFPGPAIPAEKGLGYISFVIAMLIGGHALTKKNKKNEEEKK